MFEFDINGITVDEIVQLGKLLDCNTHGEVLAKLVAAQKMAAETGDVPLELVMPMLWLSIRTTDKTFTFEQANALGYMELAARLPAKVTTEPRSQRAVLATGSSKPKRKRK